MTGPGAAEQLERRQWRAFVACAAVLAVAAGTFTWAREKGLLVLIKKAAPLNKLLSSLTLPADAKLQLRLAPPLSPEMVHELGTTEYAGWAVEDTASGAQSAGRNATVFITYYTGKADQVPHVPEECYSQGGMQSVSDDTTTITVTTPRGAKPITLRRLVFKNKYNTLGRMIFYTILCNGDFYHDRNEVRARMVNPFERYLYYCKVELAIDVETERLAVPSLEKAAERMMNAFVPVLMRDHLPDWDAVMKR